MTCGNPSGRGIAGQAPQIGRRSSGAADQGQLDGVSFSVVAAACSASIGPR